MRGLLFLFAGGLGGEIKNHEERKKDRQGN
jgi:hypothetical protein